MERLLVKRSIAGGMILRPRAQFDFMSRIWNNVRYVRTAIFHPAAREAFRGFPKSVRAALGEAIWKLQLGVRLGMPLSRRMPSIAPGVEELRVKDASGAYRVCYFTRSTRGILVCHAFEKRSQKTPPAELRLGRQRLKELRHAEQD